MLLALSSKPHTPLKHNSRSKPFGRLSQSMTQSLARLLCAATLSMFTALAQAEDNQAPPWYEVEVIIFHNLEQVGYTSETWTDVQPVRYAEIIELLHEDELSADSAQLDRGGAVPVSRQSAGAANSPSAFTLLSADNFRMKDIYRKLKNSPSFDPILHISWRQPTYDPKEAKPVYVYDTLMQPFKVPPPSASNRVPVETFDSNQGIQLGFGRAASDAAPTPNTANLSNELIHRANFNYLSGTLKLGVSRYLHFEADLRYRSKVVKEETVLLDSTSSGNEFMDSNGADGSSIAQPTTFTREVRTIQDFNLYETRRLRSKEIHYYDHPMFGLVVLVTPYELPKVEPEFDPASQAYTTP